VSERPVAKEQFLTVTALVAGDRLARVLNEALK
jgi:hypothetical protein